MKVIGHRSNYEIYEDDLKTFDKLPTGTYKVRFNKKIEIIRKISPYTRYFEPLFIE